MATGVTAVAEKLYLVDDIKTYHLYCPVYWEQH